MTRDKKNSSLLWREMTISKFREKIPTHTEAIKVRKIVLALQNQHKCVALLNNFISFLTQKKYYSVYFAKSYPIQLHSTTVRRENLAGKPEQISMFCCRSHSLACLHATHSIESKEKTSRTISF